ncbi:MAG: T9SS type A sorting domain-containing protein, partial [Ginsengibacter sp.]
ITIKNNAAGGGGNDWVLDDIKLATCYPNLVNSPKDTATSCVGAYLSLSDTVKSYFDNYTNFCWEKSLDGVNWMSTGVCGAKVPLIVNGLYQYVVDTSFKTVLADSGTYYRLKVGTTFSNLTNPNCSVGNSQKIFVKVFNTNCALLATNILNFNGNLADDKTVLQWTSQTGANLKSFEVEKSLDGVHFSQTGIVASMNNANGGNYFFTDPVPISSVAYYRLKLISDADNGDKYSKIIVLYNRNALFTVSTINPFRNDIKLNIFVPKDGDVILSLYDVFGKLVSKKITQLTKGTNQITMDNVEKLASGIYILSSQFNYTSIQNKLFKVN